MSVRDATVKLRVAQRGTPTVAQHLRRRAPVGDVARCRGATGLFALALLAGACRNGTSAADGGQGADARISCSGTTVCDGTTVRACRMGSAAEIIDDCAPIQACSLGRCTSSACAEAEKDRTSL